MRQACCNIVRYSDCLYCSCGGPIWEKIQVRVLLPVRPWMQCANRLEVCTGSKLKPEPGPYPRLSDPTRPDPSGTVKFRARTRPEIPPPPPPTNSQQKKKEKGCISRLHAKKRINQGSAISQTFTSYESLWTSGAAVAYILPSLWILYGQEDNSSTVQIMVIFCQLRLVSILSTLNQT